MLFWTRRIANGKIKSFKSINVILKCKSVLFLQIWNMLSFQSPIFLVCVQNAVFNRKSFFGHFPTVGLSEMELFHKLAYSTISALLFLKTLSAVTFFDKQKQSIEESWKFSWHGVAKKIWKIYQVIWDVFEKIEVKNGGNMGKSSFALKINAIKRSEFHVCFLLAEFSIFDLIVTLGWE